MWFALVELLIHVRIFDNLQCVTVPPSASGSSRTVFLFLLLEGELDVHATCGFFDHVERLVLRIQALVPLIFHFLPFVLHIDSEYLGILASSQLPNCLKILHRLIDGISCLPLTFSNCDFELLILTI